MACIHLNIRCGNPAAPTHGVAVAPNVCVQCAHYDGPARGLGDHVHTVLGTVGVHKIVRNCGGCAARRAALNAAMPINNA